MEGGRELQLPTSLSSGKDRPTKPQQNIWGSRKILTRQLNLGNVEGLDSDYKCIQQLILVNDIGSGEYYTILA